MYDQTSCVSFVGRLVVTFYGEFDYDGCHMHGCTGTSIHHQNETTFACEGLQSDCTTLPVVCTTAIPAMGIGSERMRQPKR